MSTSLLKAFVATAVKAARRAAREITRAANDRDLLRIEDKAANDFVTSADRAAEEAIVNELRYAYPHHAILTEEAGRIGNPKSDYLWIVDPIDGTTNFIHGLPQYAVSIGLTYRGEIIAAVVYDVAKNELFTAAKGQGAYLDNRRIRVSETNEMRRALIGTGFPFRRGDDFNGYLERFRRVAERAAGLRRPGSAALDLAWVACGRYDGFWEQNLKPWDICAGVLLVLEAGGLITDLKGGEDWFSGSICCGNPKIFGQLLPLVGDFEKKADADETAEAAEGADAAVADEKPAAKRRTLTAKKVEATDGEAAESAETPRKARKPVKAEKAEKAQKPGKKDVKKSTKRKADAE